MPNTLAENLQRLKTAKTEIANAITAKGGTVGANDGLEEFAADIATIPSGGNYSITVLWDYITDNSGTIPYKPFIGTLNDNINNYDAIQFEVVSDSGDLDTSGWDSTMFSPIIPVYAINNSLKNNYFNHTSFGERSSQWYIKDTTIQKTTTNLSGTNGLVRVYGIKF